jgi:CHASE1-domain containing sensor protein
MLSKLRLSLRSQWAWMVLAVGLTLTALSSYNLHQQNQTHIRFAVQKALDVTVEATLRRIQLYQYGLRGARGAVLTAGEHDISRAIQPSSFRARGFGFVRRVSLADEPSFLAKARADDWPDFHIHQLTQHTGERYVIQYIEPVERNLAAVGLDLASEPQRAAAALAAMRTGEVRLSGPVTLVQASGQPQQSF